MLSEDVNFSTANLFPHALFSQIDLEIDGVNLSSQDNLYPYKAYLETLLTYGHDAKISHLTTSHFAKDSAGYFDDVEKTRFIFVGSKMLRVVDFLTSVLIHTLSFFTRHGCYPQVFL